MPARTTVFGLWADRLSGAHGGGRNKEKPEAVDAGTRRERKRTRQDQSSGVRTMMLTGETREQQERRLREDNAWAGEVGIVLQDEAPDDVTPDELAALRLKAQARLSRELVALSGTEPRRTVRSFENFEEYEEWKLREGEYVAKGR